MALALELLLVEAVSLIHAVEAGDFEEARFRCRKLGDLAWTGNCSAIGNLAMNLEIALRTAATDPLRGYEDHLAFLLAELDLVLRPLRSNPEGPPDP